MTPDEMGREDPEPHLTPGYHSYIVFSTKDTFNQCFPKKIST